MGDKPTQSFNRMVSNKVIDGALAGLVGVTATFPLDLAKTRLQNQVTAPNQQPKYKNLVHTVQRVGLEEGFRGLYSGYTVNASFIVFEKALKLVANDVFRLILTDKNGELSLASQCVAGASAGACQSAVTTPMELLKIKGQEAGQKGVNFSMVKEMSHITKTQGLGGFYKGWCSTLVRDVPFSFIYFPMYANLKDQSVFGKGQSFYGNLAAGMAAGAFAGGISTPFDVIKTRLQNADPSVKISWLQCTKDTFRNEGGLKPFFKGSGPRMICIGALFAVAQGFYELGLGNKAIGALVD